MLGLLSMFSLKIQAFSLTQTHLCEICIDTTLAIQLDRMHGNLVLEINNIIKICQFTFFIQFQKLFLHGLQKYIQQKSKYLKQSNSLNSFCYFQKMHIKSSTHAPSTINIAYILIHIYCMHNTIIGIYTCHNITIFHKHKTIFSFNFIALQLSSNL